MEPILTQDSFLNLMIALDPSGANAGQRYEEIRRRLIKFFEWRGCRNPDELADSTIDRVATLLQAGREITGPDAFGFFYGVARNILREHWPKSAKKPISLDEVPAGQISFATQPKGDADAGSRTELVFACLDRCSQRLLRGDWEFIIAYYTGEQSGTIAKRKEMAKKLGITVNALRIRALRIREQLESCLGRCTDSSESEASYGR